MVELSELEPVNPLAIKFINRLSDHLFVIARHLNDKGEGGRPVAPRRQSLTQYRVSSLSKRIDH